MPRLEVRLRNGAVDSHGSRPGARAYSPESLGSEELAVSEGPDGGSRLVTNLPPNDGPRAKAARVCSSSVGTLKRIAPIFAVRDVTASLAYYRRLGFVTREYDGGGYGFVTRDGVEFHLGRAAGL